MTAARFWARVIRSARCWEWTGARGCQMGYGSLGHEGRTWTAHRFSWTLTHGPIPKGRCVLHHCDNPLCVRPSHVYLGDQRDNARDAVARGRCFRGGSRRGEEHPRAKITAADVEEIRRLGADCIPQREIAEHFGIGQAQVQAIIVRRYWKHVA